MMKNLVVQILLLGLCLMSSTGMAYCESNQSYDKDEASILSSQQTSQESRDAWKAWEHNWDTYEVICNGHDLDNLE